MYKLTVHIISTHVVELVFIHFIELPAGLGEPFLGICQALASDCQTILLTKDLAEGL